MKTPVITPNISAITRKHVMVKASENSQRPLLYNEVMDVVKTHKVPATVTNRGIELPSATGQMLDKLTELGIKFVNVIKK